MVVTHDVSARAAMRKPSQYDYEALLEDVNVTETEDV